MSVAELVHEFISECIVCNFGDDCEPLFNDIIIQLPKLRSTIKKYELVFDGMSAQNLFVNLLEIIIDQYGDDLVSEDFAFALPLYLGQRAANIRTNIFCKIFILKCVKRYVLETKKYFSKLNNLIGFIVALKGEYDKEEFKQILMDCLDVQLYIYDMTERLTIANAFDHLITNLKINDIVLTNMEPDSLGYIINSLRLNA
jgi:hypothetical protein